MLDKDSSDTAYSFAEFFQRSLPYISTLFISCWGGVVSHIQKLRISKKSFNIKELLFDLIISSFAGLLTYYFCVYAKVGSEMSAILIAVSGHMGTRAIAGFEKMRDRVFGVTTMGEDIEMQKGVDHDKQP